MPKFFVEQDQIADHKVTLFGDDAKHISYALRMAKGERITVCDKREREYDCVLTSFEEGQVTAEIVAERVAPGEPPLSIYLYQGLPKGDKLETVIQKAVECGASEITPFESERCVARVKPEAEERKTERRNKIACEAAKQCGRGRLPSVNGTVSFDEAIQRAAQCDLALICYEDEKKTSLRQVLAEAKGRGISSVAILVGSEGGFSENEVKRANERGLLSVGLGSRILRTETAPVFVLGCLAYEFEL